MSLKIILLITRCNSDPNRTFLRYKPGFHFAPTFPQIDSDGYAAMSKFHLSPLLLLPDSFGDIYAGEKFSAYIAVVNGYHNVTFHNMSLSVRLQTSSMVIYFITCPHI